MQKFDLEKYARLAQRHEGIVAARLAAREKWEEARQATARLETQRTQIRLAGGRPIYRQAGDGVEVRVDTDGIPPELEQALDRARRQEQSARQAHEALAAQLAESVALMSALTEFLKDRGFHRELEDLPVPTPLARPDTPPPTIEQIEAVRRKVAEFRKAQKALDRAHVDRASALARLDTWLDEMAARPIGSVTTLLSGTAGVPELFPRIYTEPSVASDARGASVPIPVPQAVEPDAIEALLVRLHRDPLRALLVQQLDDAAAQRGGWGLTPDALAAERERIARERFAAERTEERLISQLDAWGIDFARRGNASPEAVLAIDGDDEMLVQRTAGAVKAPTPAKPKAAATRRQGPSSVEREIARSTTRLPEDAAI